MRSRLGTFLIVTLVAGCWIGGFLAVSRTFAPQAAPVESDETLNVKEHLAALAKEQRRRLGLDAYYGIGVERGMAEVILEFNLKGPLPLRSLGLDGFTPKHINVCNGQDGTASIFAVMIRPAPYIWPRSLDVMLGKDVVARADLEDSLSTTNMATYRVANDVKLAMNSPNGHFRWEVTKDKQTILSTGCIYRQDLYRNGEWYKSLVALTTTSAPRTATRSPNEFPGNSCVQYQTDHRF